MQVLSLIAARRSFGRAEYNLAVTEEVVVLWRGGRAFSPPKAAVRKSARWSLQIWRVLSVLEVSSCTDVTSTSGMGVVTRYKWVNPLTQLFGGSFDRRSVRAV